MPQPVQYMSMYQPHSKNSLRRPPCVPEDHSITLSGQPAALAKFGRKDSIARVSFMRDHLRRIRSTFILLSQAVQAPVCDRKQAGKCRIRRLIFPLLVGLPLVTSRPFSLQGGVCLRRSNVFNFRWGCGERQPRASKKAPWCCARDNTIH